MRSCNICFLVVLANFSNNFWSGDWCTTHQSTTMDIKPDFAKLVSSYSTQFTHYMAICYINLYVYETNGIFPKLFKKNKQVKENQKNSKLKRIKE